MFDVDHFAIELRNRMRGPDGYRPFVCDGSPLDCRVLIVGCNPATDTETSFWQYWREGYGFDRASWERDYRSARLAQGKRQLSNTRHSINVLAGSCAPLKCLEANVYAKPTKRQSELSAGDIQDSLLAFLVSRIRPQWIVAHGKIARAAVAGIQFDGVVRAGKHLRFRSHDELRQLGSEMRDG
ncbi:hypothetical protein [Burkholderia gladioli]|uniref:hypothetical protein n=1 Tax=Burkholderia gladioli TaxID=28095 RepID=UPI0016403471|nr:hypothetical protein [Burkholderia gladioli]